MNFKIDLHVHSKYSGDNIAEPEELVLRAIETKLYGIAFTEHYYYGASEYADGLKEKYRDRIMIFRGVEFSSLEGHCLIFGVDTDQLAVKHFPMRELIKIVNKEGGVVIPSHPYRGANSIGDAIKNIKGICAIEGYNGCNMQPFNIKAVDAAKELKLPFTGGSDAHAPEEVGSCYTEFDEKVTHENFIELLKKGNYTGFDTRKISRMSW